jgi:hypothetical protein
MRRLVALAVILVATSRGARADEHAPLTHTTPLTPTGEVLPRGRFERTQSVLAFYHEVALGLADGLELRLGMPGLPLPILGGDLQLRASVLPRERRLRVVIGATASAEWINGGDLWLGAAATVAWRGDRWGAHATVRALEHRLETGDRVGLATAGLTLRAGRTATLFAEAGQLSWLGPEECAAWHCGAVYETARGVVVGSWWQLDDMAIGVQVAAGWRDDVVIPLLMPAFRWDRDL